MRRIFVLIVMILFFNNLEAQEGVVMVKAETSVDTLVMLHVAHNQKYPLVQGYRIQLFKDSGNEALDDAQAIMEKFQNQFPDINAYLSFKEPYYRVRVGDFKTRIEALDRLEDIKRKYRNVWVIKDYIHFSDFQNSDINNNYKN